MEDTMKPQMPRMPWYPADFYGSTCTWPFAAIAVYRAMLDVQWMTGGLPNDPELLRATLRVPARDWRAAWPFVAPKFKPGDDGLLRNARLEQHRAVALELSGKRRDAANARWGNQQ